MSHAGGGTGSFSFYGLQGILAASGWRSCSYDRAGYGWSQLAPFGTSSVVNTRDRLRYLLDRAGETGPFILGGHSAGVEIVQIYAATYPNATVGMVVMDGYPNYLRLLGMDSAAIEADTMRVCAALQAARAFEGEGLVRAVTGATGNDFTPASEGPRYASTYTTGHAWTAQYADYCRWSGPSNTDWLTAAGAANPMTPWKGLKWPQLRAGASVLLLPAGDTVGSGGGTVGSPSNVYWQTMQQYNTTLVAPGGGGVSRCVGCSGCHCGGSCASWAASLLPAAAALRAG